jgi:hypothetical protein
MGQLASTDVHSLKKPTRSNKAVKSVDIGIVSRSCIRLGTVGLASSSGTEPQNWEWLTISL